MGHSDFQDLLVNPHILPAAIRMLKIIKTNFKNPQTHE